VRQDVAELEAHAAAEVEAQARKRERESQRERERERGSWTESHRERESQSWTESQREGEEGEFVLRNGLVLCMSLVTPESSTCLADAPELHGLYLGLRGRVSRSFSGRSQAWSLDPWSPLCVKGGSLSCFTLQPGSPWPRHSSAATGYRAGRSEPA
jgi:hypothetical protein